MVLVVPLLIWLVHLLLLLLVAVAIILVVITIVLLLVLVMPVCLLLLLLLLLQVEMVGVVAIVATTATALIIVGGHLLYGGQATANRIVIAAFAAAAVCGNLRNIVFIGGRMELGGQLC